MGGISSLVQSLFNNNKNLAVKNTATVINAEDQSANTSQNSPDINTVGDAIPEPTKVLTGTSS